MNISEQALLDDTKDWERLGPVMPGGTVFSLAISPVPAMHRIWAATGCGVYLSDDDGASWTQTLHGLSTPLLSALAVSSNGALLAGSLEGELFASFDYGKTWRAGRVPQESKATVVSVLPTPKFRKDGSAFAATDGGGLLVTRNSGRSWEDSSFGLGDSTVLALAAAPDWSERETMFAATTDGVFISVNGGRAWRETELMLDEDTVDVLAISPAFDRDRTLFAGTENGDIYRSDDGGRTWDMLVASLGDGSINALWIAPDFEGEGMLLAGVGAQIFVSRDGGDAWEPLVELPGAVLTLAGDGNVLLAGMHEHGIWRSTDGGATWGPASESFSARGYARLVVSGEQLFVLGPQEGLCRSRDGGATWECLPGLESHVPVLALHATANGELLVASQKSGILRSADAGATWEVVYAGEGIQAITLAEAGGFGWAGTANGGLLVTQDGGVTWEETISPCEGNEILALAASPTFAQDHTVLLGAAMPATLSHPERVALWRSTNGGAAWRAVTAQATPARWMDITMSHSLAENAAEQAVIATGAYIIRPLRRAREVWISVRVDPYGANALGVLLLGSFSEGGMLVVATGNGLYRSVDGGKTWDQYMEDVEAQSFISIAADYQSERTTLYALSLGGSVFRHQLP